LCWSILHPSKLISGTLISTYLLPLHHKYCVSTTSTLRSRITFYSILFLSSIAVITPLPYLLTPFIPMSKPLWTPPFLIQTIGVTLLSWLLASVIDLYPAIPGTQLIEAMGRRSLEVYLAAEILQEFVMFPGKRRGGGLWETWVRSVVGVGVAREWSCLLISFCWAGVFAGFGWFLDRKGWRIKL
jgi:predicted acyltransferase